MTIHSVHPADTVLFADDCPRCKEIVNGNFAALDGENTRRLYDMTHEYMCREYARKGEHYKSNLDLEAMHRMEDHIILNRMLTERGVDINKPITHP